MSAPAAGSASPSPGLPDGTPPTAADKPPEAAGKPSRRKKVLTPIVLAAIGVALFVWGALVLPSPPPQLPSPPYTELQITSLVPISAVEYTVTQVSPDLAEMKIMAELFPNQTPPVGADLPKLVVNPPNGIAFRNCPRPACQAGPPGGLAQWTQGLAFTSSNGTARTANADLFVKARNFGVASNGLVASAAIPAVGYTGPAGISGLARPTLLTWYHIASATSYDWSAYPTLKIGKSYAAWQEQLVVGNLPGQTAVGVNNAGQASNQYSSLIAGVLFGLAGAAIIAAIQEALHATG